MIGRKVGNGGSSRAGGRGDIVRRRAWSARALWLLLLVPAVGAAGAPSVKPVQFAKGASSSTVQGRITGDQTIDHTLRARGGQTLTVTLDTRHTATYFNVLPPRSEAALFVGSTGGNSWSGSLPADGEYRVRVYMMRSAARRGETAGYALTIGVTGTPAPAAQVRAPAADAKVPGTPYHATGPLPCTMGGQPAQCEFGVIRQGTGSAEVHVTPNGGLKRVLRFAGDRVGAADGSKVKATKSGDIWNVEVNDFERYTIPEAVINGG